MRFTHVALVTLVLVFALGVLLARTVARESSQMPLSPMAPGSRAAGGTGTTPATQGMPVLAIEPTTGPPGTMVRFVGTGFTPGGRVSVLLIRGLGLIVANAVAGSTGTITGTFRMPAPESTAELMYGPVDVFAIDDATRREIPSTRFVLTQPTGTLGASMVFEIPVGWGRDFADPVFERYRPALGSPIAIGIRRVWPPPREETALLPPNSMVTGRAPIALPWGEGSRYTLNGLAPGGQGNLVAREMHLLVRTAEGAVYQLFAAAPPDAASERIAEQALNHLLNTARSTAPGSGNR
jgi:hypothetical protein